ncbi:hypothetical protein M430DRAFT_40484 [Amorphotheca resinae ATCC 22711]|uniref:Uncharacterized protein n=1 Tax=Amorphotheca resinae ATCC 22711 TaxID=857342 RepID=A0A2T3B8T2_AMORE|nr:hypothetical protein M430DRAFT_40484 [Amorphotheca resinae ATCC 22711]PSS23296.1 hypothetical protein M430DRAFT_40484 [Amorphotheca resinae ATCC 22711]
MVELREQSRAEPTFNSTFSSFDSNGGGGASAVHNRGDGRKEMGMEMGMVMEMEMGKRQRAKGLFSVPFALCRWPPSAPPPTPLSQCQRSASPLAFLAPSSTALWSLRRRGLENERHGANHDAASQDQGRLKALATAWPAQTQSAPSTRMRRCWPNLVVVRCRHSVGSRRKRTRLWPLVFCFQQPTYGVQSTARCTCTAATSDAATTTSLPRREIYDISFLGWHYVDWTRQALHRERDAPFVGESLCCPGLSSGWGVVICQKGRSGGIGGARVLHEHDY